MKSRDEFYRPIRARHTGILESSGNCENILKAKFWEDGHAREDGFRDYFLFHYRLSSVLSNVILRKDTLQAYLVDPPGSDTWDFT